MSRRRSLANTPISLRSLAWIVVAALLGSAVLESGQSISPGLLVAAGAVIMCAIALGPLRGFFRDGRDDDSADELGEAAERRLDEVEARLADTTALEGRLAELEERVDFAERLLAQRGDAPSLPIHRTPV